MTAKPAITGIHNTRVGELPRTSCLSLHAEAALGAIGDAGLRVAEIDGVLCAYSFTEPHLMLSSVFCEHFGIRPSYTAAIQLGGATACAMVMQAAALVASGTCRHVLAVTGETARSRRWPRSGIRNSSGPMGSASPPPMR
jgi:acetyl-CoA acetyltransferase